MPASLSPRLALSYGWSDGDNSWGAPLNADILTFDALIAPWFLSVTATTPPTTPTAGDAYWLPGGVTGTWAGNAGKVACYQGGAWRYCAAPKGLRAWVVDTSLFRYFNGTAWTDEPSGGGVAGAATLPIAFLVTGRPAASGVYNIVMGVTAQMPANFAGTVYFSGIQPTANTVVTVKKIAGGATTTTIGTATLTPATRTSVTLSTQAAVSFAVGDVLQISFPATQDATLADLSIAFVMTRT